MLTKSRPMRAALIALFMSALPVTPLLAADLSATESAAVTLRDRAMAGTVAYDLLQSLTTEIGPRTAGSAAEKRAADWAAEKFRAMGLQNIRIERFDVPLWERGLESVEILSPYPQPLVAGTLGGSVATPEGGIEGELAYFESFDDLLRAKPGSLSGRIAYVNQHMIASLDGRGYGAANMIRFKGASEAAKRGASAFLHRTLGTSGHRLVNVGQMSYEDGVPKIPAAALSVPDADQISRIHAMGQTLRLRVNLQPRFGGTGQSQNVIADIPGRENPDEIVVIGAHLDSWDLGTGAIDDGAGVAIVMAAAKLIKALPTAPRRTIRVVLFGSEEIGVYGGAAYAKAHQAELGRHVIATESDFGAERIYQVNLPKTDATQETVALIERTLTPLNIIAGKDPAHGGADVGGMKAAGVPVADLRQDGRNYFDLHHTADDTLDKVSAAALDQNAATYAVFSWIAADSGTDFRQ